MNAALVAILVGCMIAASAMTRWTIGYAQRRNMVDHVNDRSSHAAPTPRGGGLAIVASALAGMVAIHVAIGGSPGVLIGLIGGGLAVAIIGWVDDHDHVNPAVRLGVHLLAGFWLISWVGGLGRFLNDQPTLAVLIDTALVVLIAWIINLFNFMDGIDGLAASEAAYVTLGLAVLMLAAGAAPLTEAAPALAICAATIGFLRWNWPPARIFMGDVSSGFLGFAIAAVILIAARRDLALGVAGLLLLGTFISDTCVTMLRRLLSGQAIFRAHRSHGYQILTRRLQSHRRVTLANLAVTTVWLTPLAIAVGGHILPPWLGLILGLSPLMAVVWWIGGGRQNA